MRTNQSKPKFEKHITRKGAGQISFDENSISIRTSSGVINFGWLVGWLSIFLFVLLVLLIGILVCSVPCFSSLD